MNMIDTNTLVMVLPKRDPDGRTLNPPTVCWGIVIKQIHEGVEAEDSVVYEVRIGKSDRDTTYVRGDQLIPLLKTDGVVLNPQKVFAKNEAQIMLHLMTALLKQQGVIQEDKPAEARLPQPVEKVPIQEHSLVIVLPRDGHPKSACWGLVCSRNVGGNYTVQTGRILRFFGSKIVARPDQLIPVYATDGSYRNPIQAISGLRDQLILHLLLLFFNAEGSNLLRKITEPLLHSDFLLISRKGNTPKPNNPG